GGHGHHARGGQREAVAGAEGARGRAGGAGMNQLDRDLGAWAREELSREQLLAVHGAAAAALVAVHDRLTAAAAAVTVPSVEVGWAALLARIDAPAPVVPRRRPRPRRTISIAVAAALVLGGIAYAASRDSHDGSPGVSPSTTDRKSTRLNSSHVSISYAVFCLKKKK